MECRGIQMKTCKNCSKDISSMNKKAIYCSKQCYMKSYKKTEKYKIMRKKHDKKYRSSNKSKLKQKRKEYYNKNKEKILSDRKTKSLYTYHDLDSHDKVSSDVIKLHTQQKFPNKLIYSDLELIKVQKIEEIDYNEDLYDIEVEDNHNFLQGDGVYTSNCRWNKSWWRETYWIFKQGIVFKNPILLLDQILYLFYVFFSYPLRILAIVYAIINPTFLVPIIFTIVAMAFIRVIPYIIEEKNSKWIYGIWYGFFHVIFVYWILPIAAFDLKNTNWETR